MKQLLIYAFILFGYQLKAQYVSYQDGSPAREIKLQNVEGTELLYPDWKKGWVKLLNGNTYSDLMLKYNVYEDALYFLGKDNQAMAFTNPVLEFKLDKEVFKSGYPALKNLTSRSYYLVLTEGKITLLKKSAKNVLEMKEFNSATSTKKIVDQKNYYLIADGQLRPIKMDKNAFLDVLTDQKENIEAYLKTNKISFKSEEDLIRLITYYNSIN